jgi:hypothetical protein
MQKSLESLGLFYALEQGTILYSKCLAVDAVWPKPISPSEPHLTANSTGNLDKPQARNRRISSIGAGSGENGPFQNRE